MKLFIDQPATTGFSYTIPIPGYMDDEGNIIQLPNNTCPEYAEKYGTCGTYSKPDMSLVPNSTAGAAPNMWKTLQGFMGAFPQYSKSGFNFATESYGGHYGPVFNSKTSPQALRNNTNNISLHPRTKRKENPRSSPHRPPKHPNRKRLVRPPNPIPSLLQLLRLARKHLRLRPLQRIHKSRMVQQPLRRRELRRPNKAMLRHRPKRHLFHGGRFLCEQGGGNVRYLLWS